MDTDIKVNVLGAPDSKLDIQLFDDDEHIRMGNIRIDRLTIPRLWIDGG